MKLWPMESYEIQTSRNVDEIISRLQSITMVNRGERRGANAKVFAGQITASAFELRPVIYSCTSFLPELYGSFEPRADGTHVSVAMVPARATLTILAALVAFLVVSIFDRDTPRVLLTMSSYTMLGWVIALAGFWLDGGRAQQKLRIAILPSDRQRDLDAEALDHVDEI